MRAAVTSDVLGSDIRHVNLVEKIVTSQNLLFSCMITMYTEVLNCHIAYL